MAQWLHCGVRPRLPRITCRTVGHLALMWRGLDSTARAALPLAAMTLSVMLTAAEIEQVVVTGRKPLAADGGHLHGFTSYTNLDQLMSVPLNLASLMEREPGVAFNGQGGLFQTVSIRGLARQRVGNFFMDIPLLSERRAGTASSFIDPSMLSGVELVRGPATTAYGSGNIGGLIRSRPAMFSGLHARLGWGGTGDENAQFLGFGNGRVYGGISRRASDDTETPAGEVLNTQFEQYNILAGGRHETANAVYELVSLVSHGRDIGKSNNRYPDLQIANYPREQHWLTQLSRVSDGATASVYFHHQDLETAVLRPAERLDTVVSSALDFGARYARDWGEDRRWRWGVEYMGRRNVESQEWRSEIDGPRGPKQQTLAAEQDELAAFLEARREWHQLTATAGLRLTVQHQNARGWSPVDEQLWSGYLGAAWAFDGPWRATGELARGARVANLSEKYFSGTTGRGTVVGNPLLNPEIADSLDIGLLRETDRSRIELHLFHFWLDDFIERVAVGTDALSFRNQDGGRLRGLDFVAGWNLAPDWKVQLGGHYQEGDKRGGGALQDVSPNQLSAGLGYEGHPWRWSLDYRHRFSKQRVGAGEQPVGDANLLSVAVSRDLSASLSLTLWGRNLLNETYLITTDELSTAAEKIAFGIELLWRSSDG